jgi:putative endonuclease
MASIYIIESKKLNRFYTGSCMDLSYRMDQHINKEFIKSFTAKTDDWELYFFIDDLQYEQSRQIERHIKKMKSKKYIMNLKLHPAIAERLKKKYTA